MARISREQAAAFGHEAVAITERGAYVGPSGATIDIAEAVGRSVDATISYPPSADVPTPKVGDASTEISVVNRTTLAAAREFVDAGRRPAALNFAAATTPGGGFLNGARAQEESLCWSSGLYACLRDQEMYDFHHRQRDAIYSDYVIYSPDVPVFRDDDGSLLDEPYLCSFLTSPAVFADALLRYEPDREGEIGPAMRSRIDKVLAVAAEQRHDTLVLGAWGCGAFGCDGDLIAGLFAEALSTNFHGVFERVEFAITDWSPERRFIRPFAEATSIS
jgi:uncharacterized protein (TIGR02452 family)